MGFGIAVNRVTVESTTLASAAYLSELSVLELEFRHGAIYRFFDVPADCFHSLLASHSKGVYFNRNIRDCFRYERLTPPTVELAAKTK